MPFVRGFHKSAIPLGFLLCSFLMIVHVQAQVCIDEKACRADGVPSNERELQLRDTLHGLVDWINNNGGVVNSKLQIRYFPKHTELKDIVEKYEDESEDSESEDFACSVGKTFSFGLFVKKDETIEEGEDLLRIPQDLMILSDVQTKHRFDRICLLAEELAIQRYSHEQGRSKIASYMDFLEEFVFEEVKLPMAWSLEGRNLLSEILTEDFFVPLNHYEECFHFILNGFDERKSRLKPEDNMRYWHESVEVALSRSRDNYSMIPVYDMINHSNNPKNINAISDQERLDKKDEDIIVRASRQITSSEEIRHSFGLGKVEEDQWNGITKFGLGTMQMFHDFGFVESYPQRWYFPSHMLDFAVHEVVDASGDRELEVKWNIDTYPDHDAIFTLEVLRNRLASIKAKMHNWWDYDNRPALVSGVNPIEVKVAYEFLANYLDAVEAGLKASRALHDPGESNHVVEEERVLMYNLDSLYFQIYQCNDMIANLSNGQFERIESMRSAYQQIEFFLDIVTKDRCLYLDGVYQQCISYWPHYHELVVHKATKYLKEDLKRVLWVGGGDSGPLNEFLKHPNLELAVGLELDQQVTRLSYKHLASQPHYDNPKVQWWYGDASKSLLMLPKDYFGSFDLVIVDLSDTVFSLSVSAELDVIEAISLLLRPGGIFEMNELFMKKVSNVFEYSVNYIFNDVPKILDQAAIFASNDVDFMHQVLTEHELLENATLLVEKDSMLTKHRFDRIHDYRHNPNSKFVQLCKKMKEAEEIKDDDDNKPQSTAPGIMMIVEAENLTADLSAPTGVKNAINGAIEKVGLTVVSDKSLYVESPWFVIMMREGYVVVRIWSEEKYCALDLHLWSSFDSHEKLKEAIVVGALGGDLMNKSTSSFRIVAGGMFGLSNWKEESKNHGPQRSKSCVDKEDTFRDQASPPEVHTQAFEICLEAIQGTGLTAVVMCGLEEDACALTDLVRADSKFDRVIPLYNAPPKVGTDQIATSLLGAEKKLNSTLLAAESKIMPNAMVNAIFYDVASTSIANEVVSMMHEEDFIHLDKVFLAATIDSQTEIWRRRALSAMRDEIYADPLFRGMVLLNTTSSSLELSLVVSGDPFFMEHITQVVAESQEKEEPNNDGVTLEIRNILGGGWRDDKQNECDDEKITHVTEAEDYNHDDARAQYASQRALATQTLLQFSNNVDGTLTILKKDDLIAACLESFGAMTGASTNIYEDFGGDGAICAGTFQTGTAVLSWDGRYQVDLNIFSTLDLKEMQAIEKSILRKLPNLTGWLRDIQPRGYGRVVNFKDGMLGKASFYTDD